MAINTQKFLPGSTGTTKALPQAKISSITLTSQDKKNVNTIRVKTIQIDKMLKGTLASDKKNLTDKKKEASQQRKQDAENELEKKPDPKKKLMMPKVLPKMGFLDWIKNYIGNILLGYFAVRLLKHLPALKNFFTGILAVGEFIIDWGGKILNGLVTFIDWGYKAYDATLGFIEKVGGSGLVKLFEHFSGVVGTVVETLIYATIALSSQGDMVMDIAGDFIGDFIKKRAGQQILRQGATTAATSATSAAGGTAAQAGSLGAAGTAAVVAGAGLLASAIGEGAFQLRKTADKWTTGAWDEAKKDKNPFTKPFKYAWALGMSQLGGTLAIVGTLLDIVGAPFRYAIELIRYPFLDEAGKKKQATNLAKLDGRIREQFRQGLKIVSFGMLGGKKGDWGNIYGDKGAQTEMMSKMAGGGKASKKPKVAKKSKVSRAFRPTKRRKKGGSPYIPTVKVQPGKSIGGEEKLKKSPWWNPFGWGGGEEKQEDKSKDPLEYFKKYGDKFGKLGYFGPMATLGIKALVGQKPSDREYGDAALGLSALTAFNTLGFAGGGKVDRASLQQDFIKDKLKKSFTPLVDKTLNELKKDLNLDPGDSATGTGRVRIGGGPSDAGSTYSTESSGEYGDILDLISSVEAKSYDTINGGHIDGLSTMTIAGARRAALDSGIGSGAMGRYQQMPDYILKRARDIGLDPNKDLFSPENQDKLAILLINGGGYKAWKSGSMTTEKFAYNLAGTWRGLPEGPSNLTYQDRYASGNKAHTTWDHVMSVLSGSKTSGSVASGTYNNEGGDRPAGLESDTSSGGVGQGKMVTGPAGRIGVGAAYHVDTKFHRSLGMGNMTSAMDKLAVAYSARGKEIVFSGQGYANSKGWNKDWDQKEKRKVLQSAIDAHSHSTFMRAQGFLPFDYYIPDKSANRDLYHKSTEGAEILLPTFGGKQKVGKLYGGYGKSADLFDSGGKHVAMTGHGDLAFSKGGFTKSGAHKAILGERGREFVIDRDSTQALEVNFPGFLDAINRADGKAAIQVLKNYASYENRFATSASQIVPIAVPVPVPGKSSNSIIPIYGGSAGSTTDVLAGMG